VDARFVVLFLPWVLVVVASGHLECWCSRSTDNQLDLEKALCAVRMHFAIPQLIRLSVVMQQPHRACISGRSASCRVALSLPSDHVSTLARLTVHMLMSLSWVYLVFFNGLWVVFPVWILYEAYKAMSSAMSQAEMVDLVNYLKKDD